MWLSLSFLRWWYRRWWWPGRQGLALTQCHLSILETVTGRSLSLVCLSSCCNAPFLWYDVCLAGKNIVIVTAGVLLAYRYSQRPVVYFLHPQLSHDRVIKEFITRLSRLLTSTCHLYWNYLIPGIANQWRLLNTYNIWYWRRHFLNLIGSSYKWWWSDDTQTLHTQTLGGSCEDRMAVWCPCVHLK